LRYSARREPQGLRTGSNDRFYSSIENLVLWARSEIMGCALKIIQSVE
jgi:hypothetical protein